MSEISEDAPVKLKEPRKPRPSEIAAKKAKAAKLKAKKKPAKRKVKAAKRPKVVKTKKAKGWKPKLRPMVLSRPARIDLRLTKTEKAKLTAKAKATRRTITSVVAELIEKMR